MERSRPQIAPAFVLIFCAFVLLLSCAKSDKSAPTPSIIVSPAEPKPRVEQVGRRAAQYLTDPLLVEVTGRDFVWHFRYSGPDGILNNGDDVATGEELHLPCEHDVRFVVQSEDYIYSLSVPEMDLRQIAVPELTFEKEFRTMKTGVFEIQADPMCGMRYLHDPLMGRVIVQQKSLFIDWLSECTTTTSEVCSEESPIPQ